MRIDPINASSSSAPESANGAGASPRGHVTKPQPQAMSSQVESAPILGASQHEVSVQVDSDQHTIYRLMDKQSGTLVQQLPPEEILRVMRNIAEWLRESERRLKITI